MALDFQTETGRKDYLIEKLDDLTDGINATYGKSLLDELVNRLENTVQDFNDEVTELMGQLKENMARKQQMLHNIKSVKPEPESPTPVEPASSDSNLSEWEKRLENLG